MAYVPQNREDIEGKLQQYFEYAGLTNLVSGTPEHALWQILTDNLYELYNNIETAYSEKLPLNSTGTTLDLWTNFFNISRKPSTYSMDSTETNVHFFISEANRSLVNGGDAVIIPNGAEVSVSGVRKYITLDSVTIPAVDSPPYVAYVKVRAVEVGNYNNVGENELNTHNLASHIPEVAGVDAIEVSNKFAIATGTFPQLDTSLQNELQNVFGKSIGTNLEGLLVQLRSMAGVAGVEILEAKRGTGTFSVFIDSISPIISTALIAQVQSLIDVVKPIGSQGYVQYPRYKGVKIEFEIVPHEDNTADEAIQDLSKIVVPNMVAYVNNLNRGASFTPNTLLSMVTSNAMVGVATIKELKIGEFSVIQNKLINSEHTGAGTKETDWDEKWFLSSDLVSFCSNGTSS